MSDGRSLTVKYTQDGETEISWDPDDPQQVEVARQTFERLARRRAWSAYRLDAGGARQHLGAFDPQASQMFLAPL